MAQPHATTATTTQHHTKTNHPVTNLLTVAKYGKVNIAGTELLAPYTVNAIDRSTGDKLAIVANQGIVTLNDKPIITVERRGSTYGVSMNAMLTPQNIVNRLVNAHNNRVRKNSNGLYSESDIATADASGNITFAVRMKTSSSSASDTTTIDGVKYLLI